ncbi:hypothetical protein D3C81_1127100 [compost metagenome]
MMLQGLAVRHHQAVIGVGQHPRRHGIRCRDDAMAETQISQFPAQSCFELRPRTEQTQARFDLEHHGARVMHADLRAETVGPRGEKLLPVFDLGGLVISRGKAFAHGLGGGHRLACAQTKLARRRIDRLQHPALGRAVKQHQRFIGIGPLTQHGVQGQLRKQDTHPAHGDLSAPQQRQSVPYAPARHGT